VTHSERSVRSPIPLRGSGGALTRDLFVRRSVLLPAIVVASGTAAFVLLADAASENDGPTTLDPHISHTVVQDRSTVGTAVARLFTFLGSEPVVSVVTLLIIILLLERRRLSGAVALAVAMAGSATLTVGIKLAVGRPRPDAALRLGPVDHSYAFPSGHTLNSAVLLAMIAVLVVPLWARRPVRLAAWSVLAVLAVGVGLSRIYLGYHWSTDVAGSWLLATDWVTLVIAGLHVFDRRHHPLPASRSSQQKSGSSVVGERSTPR